MSISYIILAHKDPLQLRRLINGLSFNDARFYVHVDKNIDLQPFASALENVPNITLLNDNQREKCVWGGIGIVKGTLNCMKQIIADKREGYCVLLSGQDYPIKNNVYINLYLQYHKGLNFINGDAFPKKEWRNGGWDRLNRYHFPLSRKVNDIVELPSIWDKDFYKQIKLMLPRILLLLKNKIIPFQILKRRKHSKQLNPFGGSQWWALPTETIKKVVNYVDENPKFLAFNKYSHAPDETFFQTIVNTIIPKEKIVPSFSFVDWSQGGQSPVTFTSKNFNQFENVGNNFLFARKFSEVSDSKILDWIDRRILNIPVPQEVEESIKVEQSIQEVQEKETA